MTGWDRMSERRVDVISGAAMFVRRAAMEEVGLLDEAFFFYGEETDWCHRFRLAGWDLVFSPIPEITHFGGGTVRKLNHRRDVLMTQGTTRLHRKHGGWSRALPVSRSFRRTTSRARYSGGRCRSCAGPEPPTARATSPASRRPAASLAGPERGGYGMMKVLLIAPNVDATDVGEALMAFKWAEALSQRTELTVLCFQRPGSADVAGQLPRAHVVTWPEPTWAMKHERLNAMLKPAWPVFARQVRGWIAAALTTGQSFDIAHQLMPQAARYASPLRHFDVPYIIGPLGGALDTPEAFRDEVAARPSSHGFEPWTHTVSA
jgi:hypothetical protein